MDDAPLLHTCTVSSWTACRSHIILAWRTGNHHSIPPGPSPLRNHILPEAAKPSGRAGIPKLYVTTGFALPTAHGCCPGAIIDGRAAWLWDSERVMRPCIIQEVLPASGLLTRPKTAPLAPLAELAENQKRQTRQTWTCSARSRSFFCSVVGLPANTKHSIIRHFYCIIVIKLWEYLKCTSYVLSLENIIPVDADDFHNSIRHYAI